MNDFDSPSSKRAFSWVKTGPNYQNGQIDGPYSTPRGRSYSKKHYGVKISGCTAELLNTL